MSKKKKTKDGIVRAAGMLLMTETPEPQFLLMRHPDRWDLPKGHCDGKETYLETALREMREETGVSPKKCRIADDFQFDIQYEVTYRNQPGKIFPKNVRYFLAWLPDVVKIEVTEHESYEWLAWSPRRPIQTQTIDPLLDAVEEYLAKQEKSI
ncbi:8-oxo-dGTP pyrophosphatase MutT (NUDIX family) [Rhodopirellula rubra]|uniref:8-oxo-dGTP pyrophosphatase MutT (NUDIX family) n=1 Tax=Aporhodopirellula rubra TaxID=980271 RepID=A0A7W5DVL5_9BACT|nr:NUDIX domain-containing protein [Aporhodopirellula rubra]MBB3205220.1 8-oxo-dGTP pyrophosphatase MutT (NUDIX family) [Aporhodopirellula rubra]